LWVAEEVAAALILIQLILEAVAAAAVVALRCNFGSD
jgi:hypothetical protein